MTFDQHIGMTYSDSFSEAKIDTQAHHLNPTGNINGGVLIGGTIYPTHAHDFIEAAVLSHAVLAKVLNPLSQSS